MLIDFSGSKPNTDFSTPTVLNWIVDGTQVTVSILASDEVIIVAKLMSEFKNQRVFPASELGKKKIRTDVVHDVANFLFRESELGTLKTTYSLTIKQLLEL